MEKLWRKQRARSLRKKDLHSKRLKTFRRQLRRKELIRRGKQTQKMNVRLRFPFWYQSGPVSAFTERKDMKRWSQMNALVLLKVLRLLPLFFDFPAYFILFLRPVVLNYSWCCRRRCGDGYRGGDGCCSCGCRFIVLSWWLLLRLSVFFVCCCRMILCQQTVLYKTCLMKTTVIRRKCNIVKSCRLNVLGCSAYVILRFYSQCYFQHFPTIVCTLSHAGQHLWTKTSTLDVWRKADDFEDEEDEEEDDDIPKSGKVSTLSERLA